MLPGIEAENAERLRALLGDSMSDISARSGDVATDDISVVRALLRGFLTECDAPRKTVLAIHALGRQLDAVNAMSPSERKPSAETARLAEIVLREVAAERPSSLLSNHLMASGADLDLYALVLRHTMEVGHGWAAASSPLRGFYVLDRLVESVDDPGFSMHAFDARDTGEQMSRELMDELLQMAPASGIQFVQSLSGLIDQGSREHVNVRGARRFVALGRAWEADGIYVVGRYFHAGRRWSRRSRYELVSRSGQTAITRVVDLEIS